MLDDGRGSCGVGSYYHRMRLWMVTIAGRALSFLFVKEATKLIIVEKIAYDSATKEKPRFSRRYFLYVLPRGWTSNLQASRQCLDSLEDSQPRVKGLFCHQRTISIGLSKVEEFIHSELYNALTNTNRRIQKEKEKGIDREAKAKIATYQKKKKLCKLAGDFCEVQT
ncbi:hypothetical protein F0562_014934 [Nyssa sinensis]|uniref:Uncharacterized protein n=1 Tax=Nyssa sinensis TaxID=561372 RepID=A0A5J4ZSH2_9ASTE|nr:hypothetical protein F0562_014934 [Nyssa sinensis]